MSPCKTCTRECKYKLFTHCPIWKEWAKEVNKNKENTSFEEEEITISL